MQENGGDEPITDLTVAAAPNDPTDDGAVPKGRLGLTTNVMTVAANAGLLDPAGFPKPKDPGKGDNKYEYTGAVGKKATSFEGTFHGASGTYECAGMDGLRGYGNSPQH